MKPICLIPARSGSKGLKDKNMLFFDNKPLIFHTIDAAIESGCFLKEDIYVSTDSLLYKEICETKGIKVILRDEKLASDTTSSYEVNEDFLKNFSDDQVFVLLQVTSPLRTANQIREAMELYNKDSDVENVVSYTKVDKSPILFTEVSEDGYILGSYRVDTNYRRQDQKILYRPNGAIYITSKGVYLKNKSYYTEKTKVYLMDKDSSIDIDDKSDLISAIGTKFFDYSLREEKNKQFYKMQYEKLVKESIDSNIILGDSRLVDFSKEDFSNFSIGGVTLATAFENIDVITSKRPKKVLISLGINDIITSYSQAKIKDNFSKMFSTLKEMNVEIVATKIIYCLFRDSVDNNKVTDLNNWLEKYCSDNNIRLLDFNNLLSENGHLKYKYTSDGLHFNKEGQEVLFANINEAV